MESIEEEKLLPINTNGSDIQPPRPKSKSSLKPFIYGPLFSGLLLLAYLVAPPYNQPSTPPSSSSEWSHEPLPACEAPSLVPVTAPRKNIWKNIDIDNATEIRDWLYSSASGLNLTRSHLAQENDDSIFLIEARPPTKVDALRYLDTDQSAIPAKRAHVIINHGALEQIVDYEIGPLPISDETTLTPIRDIYHEPDIPYHAHGLNLNPNAMGQLMATTFGPLADLTMDLFGGTCTGFRNDTLIASASAPLSFDGSWRRAWLGLKLNVPGHYLFPLDIYTHFEMSGTDPSLWKATKIWYNRQIFDSPEEFHSAWANGTLIKSPSPDINDKSGWATRAPKGKPRDLDHRAGPRSVSFEGLRFRVDPEEDFITWMGYSFYLGFERDMGLNLWDINFRGERIIYELSPQEAMAQYSGSDPRQSTTIYLDRAFGMGASVKELMVGYDCPAEAVYLPATIHLAGGSSTRLNAICVFEQDSGRPLSRHTGWLKDEMGAIKGYELVVRSVSTVGNYDYMFDYTFQLDGSMEIRVSASGYLQGGYWRDAYAPYGHAIRDTAMGSLHDHVINFKVDLDVAGQKNSLIANKLEMESIPEPWLDEDWGPNLVQQKVGRHLISNENDSRLEYPKNMEGMYVISNEEEFNRWGHPRGYAIHPGASPVHLTNLDSKRTLHNVDWAKHHLAVTKRHENEPFSSSAWNIHLPGKPTVDFEKFFDGESLEQEDLVLWVNLGTHHIPRAEDSPHTLTNVATSYVLLTPYNFNDFDVSMEAQNAILLRAGEPGERWMANENGVREPMCIPEKPRPFEYHGLVTYEEDGSPGTPETLLDQRRQAESWHGLWAEIKEE